MVHSIRLPGLVKIGGGSIQQLKEVIFSIGCQKPCIITDKTMFSLGLVDTIEAIMQPLPVQIFADVMAEPDDKSLFPAIELVKQHQCDCLIALGGGSAIDSAKAIALLVSHGGTMTDYKVPKLVETESIPVIAIPTTAGTGSEATAVTVITSATSGEKMLCMGSGLMPKAAIVDYQLTLSLPKRVAADTAIDALTHAIEAFVSRKANLFSDQQAIAAMKLIAPNILDACVETEHLNARNIEAKEKVMLGATLAGIAFSNASVALVHGMSRPLGVHFHIPHGMSNAMLLPTITDFSLSGHPQRYAECAVYMGLVSSASDQKTAHKTLVAYLQGMNSRLDVPTLKEFGVKKETYDALISTMAKQAIASGSPANNPRLVDQQKVESLYNKVWHAMHG